MNVFFVRRGDGLTYEFALVESVESVAGGACYRRVDSELYCRRLPHFGWCVVDSAGLVMSRPFDDPGFDELPPEGLGQPQGATSHVYDMRLGSGED